MNYKRSLIGVLVVTCVGLAGCDGKKEDGGGGSSIKNNHDEPVIIENGSAKGDSLIKIDFNRGDGKDAVGYLTDDGHAFIRGNAPSVKRIRVFVAEEQKPFDLKKCKDKNSSLVDCDEKLIDPKSIAIGISGGAALQLHWSKKGKDGLVMVSPTQPFKVDPAYEFRVSAELDAQQNPISLERVSFMFDGIPQEFSRPSKGGLVVQVCVKDDPGHCTNYKP